MNRTAAGIRLSNTRTRPPQRRLAEPRAGRGGLEVHAPGVRGSTEIEKDREASRPDSERGLVVVYCILGAVQNP